jgi:hypothetical protein
VGVSAGAAVPSWTRWHSDDPWFESEVLIGAESIGISQSGLSSGTTWIPYAMVQGVVEIDVYSDTGHLIEVLLTDSRTLGMRVTDSVLDGLLAALGKPNLGRGATDGMLDPVVADLALNESSADTAEAATETVASTEMASGGGTLAESRISDEPPPQLPVEARREGWTDAILNQVDRVLERIDWSDATLLGLHATYVASGNPADLSSVDRSRLAETYRFAASSEDAAGGSSGPAVDWLRAESRELRSVTAAPADDLVRAASSPPVTVIRRPHPTRKRSQPTRSESVSSARDAVRCPSCGSGGVQRITIAKKAGAAGLFGVFSIGYAGKTFNCKSCRYKW